MNKIFDAELEIIQFNVNDIITTSGIPGIDDGSNVEGNDDFFGTEP